ncbi:MAG TPA: hypothetical protein VFQ61_36740 [Polyangiaceae bacterium]|nr:hypothetical protein [Polyangiaceae bacterium]
MHREWFTNLRYRVSSEQIRAATAFRSAGDFMGACAATRVWPSFDLEAVGREYGAALERELELTLQGFAPDLLRWNIPRNEHSITAGLKLRLVEWQWETPLALWLETPRTATSPQDLFLHFGPSPAGLSNLERCHWDARHVAELLSHAGGRSRLPFFPPDGQARLWTWHTDPSSIDPALEPEARFEKVTLLQDRGNSGFAEAASWAGFEVTPEVIALTKSQYSNYERWDLWPVQEIDLIRLNRLVRELHSTAGVPSAYVRFGSWASRILWIHELDAARPLLDAVSVPDRASKAEFPPKGAREIAWHECSRSPDLERLRRGWLKPSELHPLVLRAFFPAWPGELSEAGPAPVDDIEPLRVRCGEEWHWIGLRDGRVQALQHAPEQEAHEQVMAALGAPIPGCFRALQAWRSWGRSGRVPRRLRERLKELKTRVAHGDADGVFRFLEQDPALAQGSAGIGSSGSSMLHYLPWLGVECLPRLLALGLDLEARDLEGQTPLQVALKEGRPEVAAALLAVGAKPAPPETSP